MALTALAGLTLGAALTGPGLAHADAENLDRTGPVVTTAHGPAGPGMVDVIVTVAPSANAEALSRAATRGNRGKVTHVYTEVLNGFSATLPQAAVDALSKRNGVLRVEVDQEITVDNVQDPTPSWGLDRIDQRDLPGDNAFGYEATGSGVKAYIIDTGIDTTHPDFTGRAVHGIDTVAGDNDATDCHGHGTHVAGTVGGEKYGVAKDVTLVAVRVLNCWGSGTASSVLGGMDWVAQQHSGGPAVANLSLGGAASAALDDAARSLIDAGITVAVAAGNSNRDACRTSPARVKEALTTGASDRDDSRASFSNVGDCVDLFAPGVDITSTWLKGGTATHSGTSMAAPHVAGVAAQYLELAPHASPAAVNAEILGNTTKGVVTDTGGGCLWFYWFCTPATPNNDLLFTAY